MLTNNQKITLTIKQLRELVNESQDEDVEKNSYKLWLDFINQFGAEITAKLLSKNATGNFGINLGTIIAKYTDQYLIKNAEYVIRKAAKKIGLPRDSINPYEFHYTTVYDRFLYDHGELNTNYGLFVAGVDDLQDEIDKALKLSTKVYVMISRMQEKRGVDYIRDLKILPWEYAQKAIESEYEVIGTGVTPYKQKYLIFIDKE